MELIKFEYFKIKLNIVFKKTKCIFWTNFNFKINYFLTCQFKNTPGSYFCETLCTVNPKFYCWYLWLFNFDVKEFMVRKFGKTLGHCQYVNINTYFPKKSKLTIFFWNASFSKHKFWWNINLSIISYMYIIFQFASNYHKQPMLDLLEKSPYVGVLMTCDQGYTVILEKWKAAKFRRFWSTYRVNQQLLIL